MNFLISLHSVKSFLSTLRKIKPIPMFSSSEGLNALRHECLSPRRASVCTAGQRKSSASSLPVTHRHVPVIIL